MDFIVAVAKTPFIMLAAVCLHGDISHLFKIRGDVSIVGGIRHRAAVDPPVSKGNEESSLSK